MGSSVPRWPIFFVCAMRRILPTTSCEVQPSGLSITMTPSNGFLYLRLRAAQMYPSVKLRSRSSGSRNGRISAGGISSSAAGRNSSQRAPPVKNCNPLSRRRASRRKYPPAGRISSAFETGRYRAGSQAVARVAEIIVRRLVHFPFVRRGEQQRTRRA